MWRPLTPLPGPHPSRFDTFDCQVHYFTSPEPGKMFIKVNWRVQRPNGQFYERHDLQRFMQDPAQPAALYNHGNEVLHYQDDWYVASLDKEKGTMLVYYRGRNDAWDGYGGAVVYSRTPTLDAEAVPALREASQRLGLKWEDFQITDNSCPPEPPLRVVAPADLDTLADDVEAELQSFSRGFTRLKGEAADEAKLLKDDFLAAEQALEKIEREAVQGDGIGGFLRRLLGISQ